MAVEIKYVVVREGQEKMAFASKKDADAYDKMLDLAEVLGEWLQQSPIALDEGQSDTLAMWMAENKDLLAGVLKNGKLPEPELSQSVPDTESPAAEQSPAAEDNVSEHPGRKRTKAA
ncbi:LexA family transcriptional regulator [Enterobacter sp. Cy-643]|uniref:YebG family protein n=1 Tax=Enterobacter sp. Cy-643 TaxID=2608346 RepID=UPI0014207511|nr:YebG family protein [Enterobacter sp. Cy-643]NIF31362.1 LexA family transcriptional regulator [Enterobacter sp. Cy-643]